MGLFSAIGSAFSKATHAAPESAGLEHSFEKTATKTPEKTDVPLTHPEKEAPPAYSKEEEPPPAYSETDPAKERPKSSSYLDSAKSWMGNHKLLTGAGAAGAAYLGYKALSPSSEPTTGGTMGSSGAATSAGTGGAPVTEGTPGTTGTTVTEGTPGTTGTPVTEGTPGTAGTTVTEGSSGTGGVSEDIATEPPAMTPLQSALANFIQLDPKDAKQFQADIASGDTAAEVKDILTAVVSILTGGTTAAGGTGVTET